MCYEMLALAWTVGLGTFAVCATALLLFTAFNVEFVKFHSKLTKAAYRRMTADAKKAD